MTSPTAPSGAQWRIEHGSQVAIVVEVGGGLRTYQAAGRDVLDGYAEDAMADGARCQTLVPWPNRVQDGAWSWQGRDLQLSLTEPAQHNAIHGLVRWASWRLVDQQPAAVTVSCRVVPQPGWPWPMTVTTRWSLSDDGLTATTTIRNDGDEPAPAAAGFHPYLTVGGDHVDTATLHLPAGTYLPTGDQQIPTGRRSVTGTEFDFSSPRVLGEVELDHTFTDLDRAEDGRFRLTLGEGATSVQLWVDAAYPYLEVFTGDSLPDEDRRRRGLGVEPMSVPPNGLVTGEGVVTLAPGQTWQGSWGIVPDVAEPTGAEQS